MSTTTETHGNTSSHSPTTDNEDSSMDLDLSREEDEETPTSKSKETAAPSIQQNTTNKRTDPIITLEDNDDDQIEEEEEEKHHPTSYNNSNSPSMEEQREQQMNHQMSRREEEHTQLEDQRDTFVRNGTNLKRVFAEAFDQVLKMSGKMIEDQAQQIQKASSKSNCDDDVDDRRQQQQQQQGMPSSSLSCKSADRLTADLAREKAVEVMKLQRSLKDAQSQIALLSETSETLRSNSNQMSLKMHNTTEALKIAASNAANARADADAANAKAQALADQVQQLRRITEETKKACQLVQNEHETISSATKAVEANLMQTHSELRKAQREVKKAAEDNRNLINQVQSYESKQSKLEHELETKKAELNRARRMESERSHIEEQRYIRIHELEKDLSQTKGLLLESANAAAEQEAATAVLNAVISELKSENTKLHATIHNTSTAAKEEREKFNEELSKSEMEAQKLKLQTSNEGEEIARMKLDAKSSEKQIHQLKSRIASLEKRLSDAATNYNMDDTTNTKNKNSEEGGGHTTENSNSRSKSSSAFQTMNVSVPPLKSSLLSSTHPNQRGGKPTITTATHGGVNSTNVVSIAASCAICNKSSGLMRGCNCGREKCKLKAHAACMKVKGKGASICGY